MAGTFPASSETNSSRTASCTTYADRERTTCAQNDHSIRDTATYEKPHQYPIGIEHVVASATPPAGGSQGTGQDLSSGGFVPVVAR